MNSDKENEPELQRYDSGLSRRPIISPRGNEKVEDSNNTLIKASKMYVSADKSNEESFIKNESEESKHVSSSFRLQTRENNDYHNIVSKFTGEKQK